MRNGGEPIDTQRETSVAYFRGRYGDSHRLTGLSIGRNGVYIVPSVIPRSRNNVYRGRLRRNGISEGEFKFGDYTVKSDCTFDMMLMRVSAQSGRGWLYVAGSSAAMLDGSC